MEQRWNDTDRGNWRTWTKWQFVNYKSTWTALGTNPGRLGEKKAANRLCYGTAQSFSCGTSPCVSHLVVLGSNLSLKCSCPFNSLKRMLGYWLEVWHNPFYVLSSSLFRIAVPFNLCSWLIVSLINCETTTKGRLRMRGALHPLPHLLNGDNFTFEDDCLLGCCAV
jgi:hypothetical protein